MRRFAILTAVFALALGLVAGCDKEDDPTNPVDTGFDGNVGVPDDLALARSIPPMLANGETQVQILATVVDGKKRGLEGIGVVFSTSHGSVEPFATTDRDGIARTILTSEARATDVTAIVTAGASADTTGKPVPQGAVVVMSRTRLDESLIELAVAERLRETDDGVMGMAADGVVDDQTEVKLLGITLTALADPATIPADGQSASRVRANLIETTSRIPLEGEQVRFGASAGAITGTVISDRTGTATALLTGTTSGTTSDITIYYGNTLTTTTSVSFSALALTLSAGAAQAQPDGTWETPVTAWLVNAEQNPVAGVPIVFTSTSGAIPSPITTDTRGMAEAVLYHAAEPPRSVTVTAGFGELSEQLQIDIDPTLLMTLAAGSSELSAGGVYRTPVTARLTNLDGNPLVGASVLFTAAQGTIPSPVPTNTDGEARTTLVSSVALQSDQVTAAFGAVSQQLTVQFNFPAPATILLSAEPSELPANGETQTLLSATVLDAVGNPVFDGTAVTFSVMSGSGSIVSPATVTLDGVAEAVYQAGTVAGPVSIRATSGPAQADFPILLTPLGVGDLALSADAGTILADGLQSTVITAMVTDGLGNPVAPGTRVTFSTSRGELEDAKPTNDAGEASVRLRASRYETGTARVTAQAGAFIETLDIKMVSEEAVQIVALEVDNPSIGIQGASDRESAVITFVALDRNSIPVDEDHAITLNYDIVPINPPNIDAVVTPTTAVTNERGRASANVLSGVVAGVVEVRAVSSTIISQPIRVAIHGDLPDPDNFSFSVERLNVAGLVYDGIRNGVTARVGDQYGNPVPDSTLVYFTTDFGIIQGSAATDEFAEATVSHITAAEHPSIPGGDGLVPITVQTVSKAGDLISSTGNVMWSGPTILGFTNPTALQGFAVANSDVVVLEFEVRDANFNPLTGGTQISVTTNAGVLGGATDIEIPDTQNPAFTSFSVTLSDDDPTIDQLRSVTVTVSVTSENGDRTAFITGTIR